MATNTKAVKAAAERVAAAVAPLGVKLVYAERGTVRVTWWNGAAEAEVRAAVEAAAAGVPTDVKRYEAEVRRFSLTIAGDTREVEATDMHGDGKRFTTKQIALAKIGRSGTKLHAQTVDFWRQDDGSYRPNLGAVAMNAHGRIVAWNDEEYQAQRSRHSGESHNVNP
jgi:hypothetical protein